MRTPKEVIKSALRQHEGDDLERAKNAFRHCTQAQMQEEYGQSGKTRAQIVAEYEAHRAEVTTALSWLEKQT